MRHRRTKFILVIAGLVLSSSSITQTRNDDLNCDSTCLVPGAMGNIQPNTNTASTGPQTMPGRITSCQTPTTETTTGACPSGQVGSISYARTTKQCSDGLTSSMQYGNWTETGRSCTTLNTPTNPPACSYNGPTTAANDRKSLTSYESYNGKGAVFVAALNDWIFIYINGNRYQAFSQIAYTDYTRVINGRTYSFGNFIYGSLFNGNIGWKYYELCVQ